MAYIGREPQIGNFQVCDAISTVNNQAAYTMQVGGVNVSPETANHMLVSLNGILQAPTTSYTVSGSTITFASNLVTGDVINFIQILGSVLDLGVPSDATVTTAKIVDGAVTAAKFASGVGGKILQVVSQQYTTPITVSGVTQTYKDAAISAAITPSSTSSKVFAWFNLSVANTTSSGNRVRIKLVRDSTDIGIGTGSTGNRQAATVSALYENNDQYETQTIPVMWLDTPSSTSATTYKIQVCSNNNTSQNLFFNRGTGDVDNADHVRTVSQVLLIEIGE
jgi:hypothetical protein